MFELKSLLILLTLLAVEFLLLFLLLIVMLQRRVVAWLSEKIAERRKGKISDKIFFFLENATPFTKESLFSHSKLLLEVLENFNKKLKGEEWDALKQAIGELYLLPKARKRAKSWFWSRRNFAARSFALVPLAQDESFILSLVQDREFLVRSTASLAAVIIGSRKAIELTLDWMAKKETGYARYYYRDILLQGSTKAFEEMAKIAKEKKEGPIHLACLEVFAGKTVPYPLPFLEEDLKSKNETSFLAALKVLERNPIENTEEILLSALSHPHPSIRAEAAKELKVYPGPLTVEALEKALKDPIWEVRLRAASSLKEMGENGIAILKKQTADHNQLGYEVAQYALDFLG